MQSASYFENLPNETILDVAMEMPVDDIKTLCETCTRFNNIIGDNQVFWRKRLEREFFERQIKKFKFMGETWKEKCASYMSKYIELEFQCFFGRDMYIRVYVSDSHFNRSAVKRLKDILGREVRITNDMSLDEVNATISSFQCAYAHDVEEVVLLEGFINVPPMNDGETAEDWFIKHYEDTKSPTWSKMGVVMEN